MQYSGETDRENLHDKIVSVLKSQGMRIPQNIGILVSLVQTRLRGGLVDDKKYLVCRTERSSIHLTAFHRYLWPHV